MKALNVRLNDDVVELLDHREGELRDMSINTIINVAVRRMLKPEHIRAVTADQDAVAGALKRVISRDAKILEALKNI